MGRFYKMQSIVINDVNNNVWMNLMKTLKNISNKIRNYISQLKLVLHHF